jgi:hypothetical protein
LLGEAYLHLSRETREQSWHGVLPPLATIRQAQILTALEQAVLYRPDLDRAHALLVQLYFDANQLDRALDHLRARLRIAEQEATKPGASGRLAVERLPALKADMERLEALVHEKDNVYTVNAETLSDPSKVVERARLAVRHGLSRKALEILLESQGAIFGKAGALMQLDLMIQAGQAFEVRAGLKPEMEEALGSSAYHWLLVHTAGACGDYAAADAELEILSEPFRQVRTSVEQVLPVRQAVALRIAGAVLTHPVPAAGPANLAVAAHDQFDAVRPLAGPIELLRKEADLRVLRAMLALEPGDMEAAQRHLRAALEAWGSDNQVASGGGVDYFARPIAQQMIRLLEEN